MRSGILTSVHAFAADPERGVFVLVLLAVAIGGSLTLYALRAPAVDGGGVFAPISREGGLLINNLLLTTAATTVLLGTLYPLIADALELGKLSVGAPYFNAVFVPIMAPLAALTGIGPFLAWKRGDLNGAFQRLKVAAGAALLILVITMAINGVDIINIAAAGGMALAAWLAVATITEWVSRVRGQDGLSIQRMLNLPRSAYGHDVRAPWHGCTDRRCNGCDRLERRAH